MTIAQRIGWGAALAWSMACAPPALWAQRPAPIADPVEQALLPAGITEQSITLNARLGYLFQDEDGTDVVHLIGDAVLSLGESPGQSLSAREAVVWIMPRTHEDRVYRHLQVLLWREAEVQEVGRTLTTGPALFVTLNSFGSITAEVDEPAFLSSAQSAVYQQGNTLRRAAARGILPPLEEDASLQVLDTADVGSTTPDQSIRPVVTFRAEGTLTGPSVLGTDRVLTVVGGAYVARGVPGTNEYLEIRADHVVIFLAPAEPSDAAEPPAQGGFGGTPATESTAPPPRRRNPADRQEMSAMFGNVDVEAVYLEGDVLMSQGPNMIRADRLYYDFINDRALMLDAVVRATIVERNLPLYVRAAEIRQLSTNRFAASQARLTTSEFHTPHYHIGTTRVELTNRTPPDPTGRAAGITAGAFRIHDATLNIGGTPIAWWPYLRGSVATSETAIQSLRLGYSDDFGAEIETRWHFFNLLDLETPEGFDASLSLDYFSERGPAAGVNATYKRDQYFGELRSYVMTDNGEDNLGRDREVGSNHDVRGRFLLRHRQYLEDDWELSLELSWLSDRDFLEEFFEFEYNNDKEQETLLRLKKQRDNWAFTAMLQTRLMDFLTQTERLPDFAYFRIGEPLADRATWFSENRLGFVRFRAAEPTFREFLRDGGVEDSGTVLRFDSRQEVDAPLDIGPVRLVPFVTARSSYWDDTPHSGGAERMFGSVGVRGSSYLWRLYPETRSTMWDIDGIRHIIKADLTAWGAAANRDAHELYPFDSSVEGIGDFDGVTVGIRQRWQTKRGAGENRRTVDFFTLDVETGIFNDNSGDAATNGFASFSRPENSIARNYVNARTAWRINDRTALLSETNFDLNDREVDIFNLSLVVERPPRLSYLIGYRFIEESESNLLAFDMNYQMTEKHTLALRERFDLDRGRTLDFTVAFIRKLPRWFAAVTFDLDEGEDDFGVSFSIWPEGLPRAALGSRRFTGLGNSTELRSD